MIVRREHNMAKHRRRQRQHRPVHPGTRPGTIVIDKDSHPTTIDVIQFNHQRRNEWSKITPQEIPDLQPDCVTWINVIGLGDRNVIESIRDEFGIHPLAMEDVVNTHQRPKIDIFEDHLYLVLRMPHQNDDLETEQVSFFLGKRYILTWQERSGDCFEPIRKRIENPRGLIRNHGCDFLAYALVDAIVDSYFPQIHHYGDLLDDIEDRLAQSASNYTVVQRLHEIRHDVRNLRRYAWAQRDVVSSLMVYQGDLLTEDTRLHLSDVSDHSLRVVELLESCRESCSDLQDLYMSIVSLRMNEVMKVLTIIATIFIPLSFIAGLYGMNFSNEASPWNMPETQWTFGYPMAIVLMTMVALGMLVFFKRKGWIGQKSVS